MSFGRNYSLISYLTFVTCVKYLCPDLSTPDPPPSSRTTMNFILETLQVVGLVIWYSLESFVHLFIPTRRKNISGEVVLITGSGSGIGRLMALEFADHETVLVLWDINQEGLKETARQVKERGATRVHCYLCDCSDKAEVYAVAAQVNKCFFIVYFADQIRVAGEFRHPQRHP